MHNQKVWQQSIEMAKLTQRRVHYLKEKWFIDSLKTIVLLPQVMLTPYDYFWKTALQKPDIISPVTCLKDCNCI